MGNPAALISQLGSYKSRERDAFCRHAEARRRERRRGTQRALFGVRHCHGTYPSVIRSSLRRSRKKMFRIGVAVFARTRGGTCAHAHACAWLCFSETKHRYYSQYESLAAIFPRSALPSRWKDDILPRSHRRRAPAPGIKAINLAVQLLT